MRHSFFHRSISNETMLSHPINFGTKVPSNSGKPNERRNATTRSLIHVYNNVDDDGGVDCGQRILSFNQINLYPTASATMTCGVKPQQSDNQRKHHHSGKACSTAASLQSKRWLRPQPTRKEGKKQHYFIALTH